MKKNKT